MRWPSVVCAPEMTVLEKILDIMASYASVTHAEQMGTLELKHWSFIVGLFFQRKLTCENDNVPHCLVWRNSSALYTSLIIWLEFGQGRRPSSTLGTSDHKAQK